VLKHEDGFQLKRLFDPDVTISDAMFMDGYILVYEVDAVNEFSIPVLVKYTASNN
jgi:hypothetical protein